MGRNGRLQTFQRYNTDRGHQHRAGLASWEAFSARWRAKQGLPLLSPLHVQYLTPQDFCSGTGRPLTPAEQRRLFRHYICLAMGQPSPLRGSAHTDAVAEGSESAWAQGALWDGEDGER